MKLLMLPFFREGLQGGVQGGGDGMQADIDPDFPGSCGRCYQVRCKDGVVLGNGTTPVSIDEFYYMPGAGGSAL